MFYFLFFRYRHLTTMCFHRTWDDTINYSCLHGYYKVLENLGEGTTSTVVKAMHWLTEEHVAIKIISKTFHSSLHDTRREIDIMKKLSHPNISHLYEVMECDRYIFVIMEYVPSSTLFSIINNPFIPPDNERCIHYFRQIASAVSHLHEFGFSHRDLSTLNILVAMDGTIKLIDFSMSQPTMEIKKFEFGSRYGGAPLYQAPEYLSFIGFNTAQADMWSMGALLYHMLYRKVPFIADTIEETNALVKRGNYVLTDDVSSHLNVLITQLMCKEPNERLSSKQLLDHPVLQGYETASIFNCNRQLDDQCLSVIADIVDTNVEEVRNEVSKWEYNYMTSTYMIMWRRKQIV